MDNKFESKSTLRLILAMGLPPILSMLIQSMYSIIDAWYVAKVSEEAFNAVSLVYPLQTIILSIAVGLGVAINGAIARSLGKKNKDKAEEFTILGIMLTFIHYAFIVVMAFIVINPFIKYNATSETAQMAKDYINIVSYCSIGILFHLTFEKILQGNGNMIVPTIAQIIGCILNIILDHIFVLVLGYGVVGAATATVISQCTSGGMLALYVIFNKKYTVSLKKLSFSKENLNEIYKVCLPATIMMCLPSLLTMGLNSILTKIDTIYVTVLNLYLKVQTFVFMPIVGLLQGLRPIVGYYYGANKPKKLKESLSISFIIISIVMVIGGILFTVVPSTLIKIFFDSPEIIEHGEKAFRIFAVSFIFVGVSYLFNTFYESIGYGVVSLVINLSRQFVITIILTLLFVYVLGFGAVGVWYAIIIAEIFTGILVALMFLHTYKNTNIFIEKSLD
ncbi:MAG: MATE family efflux transporter [bacterium]